MAERILVMADSGSGKSTSIRTLDHEKTFVSQVVSKALPFKGWRKKYTYWDQANNPKGNLLVRSTSEEICNVMRYIDKQMPHIKYLIIDDAQYVMSKEYMERADEKGYGKFADIAQHMSDVLMLPDKLREDLYVVFLWHTDVDDGITRMKTVGKMLTNAITPEGLFTYVLMGKIIKKNEDEVEHVFITKSDGTNTVKTPMGLFNDVCIPNDLKLVLDTIHEYNYGE